MGRSASRSGIGHSPDPDSHSSGWRNGRTRAGRDSPSSMAGSGWRIGVGRRHDPLRASGPRIASGSDPFEIRPEHGPGMRSVCPKTPNSSIIGRNPCISPCDDEPPIRGGSPDHRHPGPESNHGKGMFSSVPRTMRRFSGRRDSSPNDSPVHRVALGMHSESFCRDSWTGAVEGGTLREPYGLARTCRIASRHLDATVVGRWNPPSRRNRHSPPSLHHHAEGG